MKSELLLSVHHQDRNQKDFIQPTQKNKHYSKLLAYWFIKTYIYTQYVYIYFYSQFLYKNDIQPPSVLWDPRIIYLIIYLFIVYNLKIHMASYYICIIFVCHWWYTGINILIYTFVPTYLCFFLFNEIYFWIYLNTLHSVTWFLFQPRTVSFQDSDCMLPSENRETALIL